MTGAAHSDHTRIGRDKRQAAADANSAAAANKKLKTGTVLATVFYSNCACRGIVVS